MKPITSSIGTGAPSQTRWRFLAGLPCKGRWNVMVISVGISPCLMAVPAGRFFDVPGVTNDALYNAGAALSPGVLLGGPDSVVPRKTKLYWVGRESK